MNGHLRGRRYHHCFLLTGIGGWGPVKKKAPRRVPFGFGGEEGDRTLDLRIANATLSQLSYFPEI